MNKLPQQKTDDQKVARLKQARKRLHRSWDSEASRATNDSEEKIID